MAKEQTANSKTTNGWDTVYAVYYPEMNQLIKDKKTTPASFNFQDKDTGASYTGTFEDWQLAVGGSGADVYMQIPVPSSTYTDDDGVELSLPNRIVFVIELNLDWITHPNEVAQELKVNPNTQTVSVLSTTNWGENEKLVRIKGNRQYKLLSDGKKGAIEMYLCNWIKANLDKFQHTFAVVDINNDAANANPKLSWLAPTDKAYAVVDDNSKDINKCIFGVLCMTENNPSPEVSQIAPELIPDGCQSALVLNRPLLLKKLLLPNIPLICSAGTTVDAFEITNKGTTITNKKDISFPNQKLENPDKIVTPTIGKGNFSITLEETFIKLEFIDLSFEYSPGIHVKLTHHSNALLSITPDGKFKMDVNTSEGGYSTAATVVTDKALAISEIVMNIGLSIAGAVAGGFIESALGKMGQVVAGTAEAAVTIATEAAAESAAEAVSNLSTEVVSEAAAESAATVAGKSTSFLGKMASFFTRQWPKILGSMVGGGVGATISEIPTFVTMMANSSSNNGMPTLDQLGTEALRPVQLGNLNHKGFQIVKGVLDGPFCIGINMKKSKAKVSKTRKTKK